VITGGASTFGGQSMARGAWIIAPWNGDLCVRLHAEVQRQNVRRQFEKAIIPYLTFQI
jgi:hypothetical protein